MPPPPPTGRCGPAGRVDPGAVHRGHARDGRLTVLDDPQLPHHPARRQGLQGVSSRVRDCPAAAASTRTATAGCRAGDPIGAPGGGDLLLLAAQRRTARSRPPTACCRTPWSTTQATGRRARRAQVTRSRGGDELEPHAVDLGGDSAATWSRAQVLPDGTRLIRALDRRPSELHGAAARLVVGGTAIGLLLVGLGGTVLVRRSLRPCTGWPPRPAGRGAAAGPGQVALAERVPAADTDPRTEVGQVGAALNRCSTTSSPRCRRGRRARCGCASSSPTPATSCARRWPPSAATPS